MKRSILALVTGLFAGTVGFYAAFFALLAITGLAGAELMPVVTTAGALGLGLAVVSVVHDGGLRRSLALGVVGAALGAGLGALIGQMIDSFEWTLAATALLITVAALWLGSSPPASTSSVERSD
jgi:hypothetical protein